MNEKRLVAFTVLFLFTASVSATWFTGDVTTPTVDGPGNTNSNSGGEAIILRGDVNEDDVVNQKDVEFLVNYLFKGGSAPNPLELGDVDGDDLVSISDLTYLIDYLDFDGPAPEPINDTPEVEYIRGDLDNDGTISVSDITFLVNYLYKNGTVPNPLWVGDADGNGGVGYEDINYLTNYLFKGGPAPVASNASVECIVNSDCSAGKICSGGLCVSVECIVDSDCTSLEKCINNNCIPSTQIIPNKRGDLNSDGNIDVADLTFLVNYLYKNAMAPNPLSLADVNADGIVDEEDLTYLTDYLFKGGNVPAPYSNLTLSTCTDSDGGLDYYTSGKIATGNGDYEDSCVSEDFVLENYCFGNQAGSMKIRCEGTCENGACKDETQTGKCQGVNIVRGDVNKDGKTDSSDINFLVSYIFKSGSAPEPVELGDANNDGNVNVGDLTYLVSYVNSDGPAPLGVGIKGPPISARIRLQEVDGVKYCDPISLQLISTKEIGAECVNDYECNSNTCLDGECVSIKQELERQAGLLKKIWCKITNLGSSSGYDQCLGADEDGQNPGVVPSGNNNNLN